ncbi:unnamed protein product [Lathyrus sativus]|nr:unnamed protein product [Lathyrus sativus]
MGYALNQPTFHYYRSEIGMANADALRWLDNIPSEKWTRAFDGGRRWGHMTTNLVESLNVAFKGMRNFPITALVSATYYRLGSLFAERGAKWSAVLNFGQTFTYNCLKVMKQETTKSITHQVKIFDYTNNVFSVKKTMDHSEGKHMGHYKVNLLNGFCDCGKFNHIASLAHMLSLHVRMCATMLMLFCSTFIGLQTCLGFIVQAF